MYACLACLWCKISPNERYAGTFTCQNWHTIFYQIWCILTCQLSHTWQKQHSCSVGCLICHFCQKWTNEPKLAETALLLSDSTPRIHSDPKSCLVWHMYTSCHLLWRVSCIHSLVPRPAYIALFPDLLHLQFFYGIL